MIVRFTNTQWGYLLKLSWSDEIRDCLENAQPDKTPNGVWVRAPYICWAIMRQQLMERTFTPRGGRHPEHPKTLFVCLQIIQTAINAWDRHPAMRDKGVSGKVWQLLPAWVLPDGRRLPRPCNGDFVVLEPVHIRGGVFTEWRTREPSPGDDRLCHEQAHLLFWPEAERTLHWSPDVD